MRVVFSSLFLLLLPILAQEGKSDLEKAFERLENGSVITDLVMPEYDGSYALTQVMKAKSIIRESREIIHGNNVSLQSIIQANKSLPPYFFQVESCTLNPINGTTMSSAPTTIESESFYLKSQGFITEISRDKVRQPLFLKAPVRLAYTSLNPTSIMKNLARNLILTAMGITTVSAQDTSSEAKNLDAQKVAVMENFAADLAKLSHEQLLEFAKKHNIELPKNPSPITQPLHVTDNVPSVPSLPAFKLQKDSVHVVCSGAAFYDPKSNSITMLKDVTVRDDTSALTANDELQIFLNEPEKKSPEKNDEAKKPVEKKQELASFKLITASGGVRIESINQDGKKMYASGDTAEYNPSTEIFTIRGKQLVFQQTTDTIMTSTRSNSWLTYNKKTKETKTSEGWQLHSKISQ